MSVCLQSVPCESNDNYRFILVVGIWLIISPICWNLWQIHLSPPWFKVSYFEVIWFPNAGLYHHTLFTSGHAMGHETVLPAWLISDSTIRVPLANKIRTKEEHATSKLILPYLFSFCHRIAMSPKSLFFQLRVTDDVEQSQRLVMRSKPLLL